MSFIDTLSTIYRLFTRYINNIYNRIVRHAIIKIKIKIIQNIL